MSTPYNRRMLAQLLTTKLHIPKPRPQVIKRQQLLNQLSNGSHGKLTLISAPAGFGKTTVVSTWIQSATRPVAWLSLDEEDSDLARFLTYFIAALQTIKPEIGANFSNLTQAPQLPSLKSLLTTLLNEIAVQPEPFLFVWDDYHVLDNPSIHEGVTFLLNHLPPQMHLIIITREDPPLPLARLRVRGQMTELRAADLRFTEAEAADFLNRAMGLSLSEEQISALEQRTEGWIAGLQLAALSMRGQQETTNFVNSFTGSHRFVLDYLVEEVLNQQPQKVQEFLIKTAILQRLCGSLCDAVMGASDSAARKTLEQLEQANLFIIPLDNERHWYRYQHLFADLLQQRLHQTVTAEQLHQLHQRASVWFEEQDMLLEAFQHAATAGDLERAEWLLKGKGTPLYYRGIVTPILEWLSALPAEVMNGRPSLWVLYASVLTIAGQNNEVEPLLKTAESCIQAAESTAQTRDLIGQIAALRARLATPSYDSETILTQSRLALTHLDPDNLPIRTTVIRTMGAAYQYQGNYAAAREAYTEAIQLSEASGNTHINILASTGLGIIQESEIQLHLAAESFRRVLTLAGDPPLPAACAAYLGLARLAYEWNDLETAEQHSQQALQLSQHYDNIALAAICELLVVKVKLAQGDLPEATRLLTKAEQFLRHNHFTDRLSLVAAVQIRLLLQQGALDAAARLAEKYQLPLSKVRVSLAQGDGAAAVVILKSIRQEAEEKVRTDEQLKLLILFALAHAAAGETEKAAQTLRDALERTQPEGFIRTYVDEGEPLKKLLLTMRPQALAQQTYLHTLLDAFGEPSPPASLVSNQHSLIEPLTERELEVLQLLAEGLSNQEIGQRLFLSLSTIKGHNSNIYGKLQANRRTEAVARAQELGLI
ncbi:MAG: hypothetical protein KDE51_18805 [Anaerolineales bacterium]|nr:hypothetical protein [Anaerolineales bacterium]